MHLIVLRNPKIPRTNGGKADLQLAAFPDESRVRDPVLLDVLLLWLQQAVLERVAPMERLRSGLSVIAGGMRWIWNKGNIDGCANRSRVAET